MSRIDTYDTHLLATYGIMQPRRGRGPGFMVVPAVKQLTVADKQDLLDFACWSTNRQPPRFNRGAKWLLVRSRAQTELVRRQKRVSAA